MCEEKTSALTYAGRFLSGRPMDGKRRTDATFFRRGTKQFDPRERVGPRWYRPEWQPLAVRLGCVAELFCALDGYLGGSWTVGTIATAIPTGVAGVGGYRGYTSARHFSHRRRWLKPLDRALAPVIGVHHSRPEAWLVVPRNFRDPDYRADAPDDGAELEEGKVPGRRNGEIIARLPADFVQDDKLCRLVHRTVAGKLGIGIADLEQSWHMVGAKPEARFRRVPRPPKRVPFVDVEKTIRSAGASAFVLGVGTRGRVIDIDLDQDSPHVGVSCGSGAGKSVLLRTAIAQFLHKGWQVVVLDKKRTSQKWCKDLPGVTYCRTGEQFHHELIRISAEVDRRAEVVDATAADEEAMPDVGPRIVCVFEEQNMGMKALKRYWEGRRATDRKLPARSPALDAYENILCCGREFRVHMVSVAQLFTDHACGGDPAARANYGIRILGRATRKAWEMLAPECGPHFPHKSRTMGRMHMVLADKPTEVQVAFLSVREARALAKEGPVEPPATWTNEVRSKTTPKPAEPIVQLYSSTEVSLDGEGLINLSASAISTRKNRAKKNGEEWPRKMTLEQWQEKLGERVSG